MSSKWKTGKYVFEMLTPKPKVKIKGQSTVKEIKEKGKQFKKKIADDERKESMTRYFTNQPPKKTKKTKSKVKHYTAPKDFTW